MTPLQPWHVEIGKVLAARCKGQVVTASLEVIAIAEQEIAAAWARGKKAGSMQAARDRATSE